MRKITWAVGCLLAAWVWVAPAAMGADAAQQPAPEKSWVDTIKKPVDWFSWGADLRIREEYLHNNIDFTSKVDDDFNQLRVRARLWTEFGPFFGDESLTAKNGLFVYARVGYEPRYYIQSPIGASPFTMPNMNWNEVFLDNLYVDIVRPAALPVSLRIGRQDLVYGRGWVILDGTPRDGSRSIYNDAIKLTLHIDDAKTNIDFFAIDNKASQSRVWPLDPDYNYVSEFNEKIGGIYLRNNTLKDHEFNVYYLYKDSEVVKSTGGTRPTVGRTLSTYGGLAQGRFLDGFDYYVEGAYQWGRDNYTSGGVDHNSYGFTGDLGYTFAQCPLTPRIHGEYEYLSGDNRNTGTNEGWDSVLSRWPRFSELYASRWAVENGGQPGNYTNLQRFTVGASIVPLKDPDYGTIKLIADYSYLLGNETLPPPAVSGTPFPGQFGTGGVRGSLYTAKMIYDINRFITAHLWAEYFNPEPKDFYVGVNDAMFLRWEVLFKF